MEDQPQPLRMRVRIKKKDGKAELTEKYLRFIPDDFSDASQVTTVPWSSVQDQQVSSTTSPKAMIRLRMSNNATIVLEFLSDKDLEEAFEFRDQAKDFISQKVVAMGKHRHSTSDRTALCNTNEIKQRAALLASNPNLKRQHTEMVNQGLISEEDFWASRHHLIANEASKRQKTAKTSAILTDVTGDNETGGTTVKYSLNPEVIHQIFIQYPAVYTAYKAQVPDKMSEKEFWGAFFKSKYFHRDRKAGHEDLFTKYEEAYEKDVSNTKIDPRGLVDPLVDLTTTEEDTPVHHHVKKNSTTTVGSSTQGSDKAHINISKFNRHGAYVLDPAHAGKLQTQTQEAMKKHKATYHDSIQEATELDDLKQKQPPTYHPLALEDESRYFQNNQVTTGLSTTFLNSQDTQRKFAQLCLAPFHLERAFVSNTKNSFDVMMEILSCADSGAETTTLMGGATAVDMIPNEFKKQIYNQFHDVSELLRHFLSFKAKVAKGDVDAKHKLNKIVDKMGHKYDELVKIRENLPPHEKNLLAPLLKPFDDQLNLAFI
jgi:transcription initiation factor TFIIH subunit 1